MVSRKRLNHRSSGYRAIIVPKAPRSKRGPRKDLVKGSELCAFDLLAAVAGKLLQESESSASSNVAERNTKLGVCLDRNEKQQFVDNKPVKSESLDHGSCAESAFVPEISIHEHSDNVKNHPIVKDDPTEECENTNALINLEDSVHLPLYSDPQIPDAMLQLPLKNVGEVTRDDEENLSGRDKASAKIRSFRAQPRVGHSWIRNTLMRKHIKADPMLKDCGLYKIGEGMRFFYERRKRNYTAGRWKQAPARIKKRKRSDHSSAIVSDQDTSSNSISNFSKRISTGLLDTVEGNEDAKDHHVKVSIKSLRVPELCIEVPENASLGSLKKAVMETVTAIFGSGFQVGVVLQGNMVQDDHKTLQEAGISDNSNLNALGFTLEPSFTKVPSLLLPESDQELPRSPAAPMVDSGISDAEIDLPPASKFDGNIESNEFRSSPQTSTNEIVPNSMALLPVPPVNPNTLAVVPVNQKPKRNEPSHRRTRRPFTVAEVEALVASVEKLGTGRWRDVKIGSFENADHRTYVDLKDKWKTLVHTARISPQQRRGEPVPQQLLDRVMAAHSYWSLKQPGKQPVEPVKTVVASETGQVQPYRLEGSASKLV